MFQGLQGNKSLKPGSANVGVGAAGGGQTPSISITALPRASAAATTGLGASAAGVKTATGKDGKPSFVICEICDGYIKDLEQLRNHMNFIHKVKIHPKMIYNRPPLNCQKCQHRFFTDQGLERHLLGTHGLVTSSMQEAANKSKDAGRCPICGKVFQWKLLNHVARDHKMTLKPAHLSYKCTVCTATFNMYRLFENHVYSAHSVVSKQKEGGGVGGGTKATNGSAEAPLKINDEITIIPQPSSSNSGGGHNKTSSSSGSSTAAAVAAAAVAAQRKKDGTPTTVSKEITITKVGTAPIGNRSIGNRNSSSSGNTSIGSAIKPGSSVEVISLDDSPSKKVLAVVAAASGLKRQNIESALAGPSKKSRTS